MMKAINSFNFKKYFGTYAKRHICFVLCIVLLLVSAFPVFASGKQKNNDNDDDNYLYYFNDVKGDFWAYDQIMWMLERKIIEGVGNNYFNPNSTVTRAEFAKMMVKTLNLELYRPETAFFLDVSKKDWEFPYVETAKKYLTGYHASNGDYFRPSQAAVREDMAVALVKALNLQNEAVDESVLSRFADAAQISLNLRKYVALAVKHGLIAGSIENGVTYFKPLGKLTRAEAATLLYRVFMANEDKITYDDEKVTYDEDLYITPYVRATTENGKLKLSWTGIGSAKFQGYMVVISKYDSTPTYPENGFLYWITDKKQTSVYIDNSTAYSGGDFGQYLEKGGIYYFTVVAVYNDKNVTGNVVRKTYLGDNNAPVYIKPDVSAVIENGKLVLKWNKIDSTIFKGYRVVISKNNAAPKYPDDGYLYFFADKNTTSAVIDNSTPYNGGDFGSYLVKGERYYFNITAIYNDKNISGDAVQFIYPGNEDDTLYPAPNAYLSTEYGNLVLRWDRNNSTRFKGYRVVISQNDPTPQYPDNGYLYYYTNRDMTYAVIDNATAYTDGDFGKYLVKGQKYYFSVTAVYDNRYVTSKPLEYVYNGENNTDIYQKPVVTVDDSGNTVIRWNRIDNVKFQSYRVVISKYNPTPKYPDQGYLYEIKDSSKTYATINNSVSYTNGDFGKYLNKGEKYYVSVTAQYTDRNIPGNAILFQYNGNENPEVYVKPVVRSTIIDGKLVLYWDKIESPQLLEYRAVISKNDSSPVYPANGFYKTALDKNTTSIVIDVPDALTNSDIATLQIDTDYYFSITAIYSNNKYVAGNTITARYMIAATP